MQLPDCSWAFHRRARAFFDAEVGAAAWNTCQRSPYLQYLFTHAPRPFSAHAAGRYWKLTLCNVLNRQSSCQHHGLRRGFRKTTSNATSHKLRTAQKMPHCRMYSDADHVQGQPWLLLLVLPGNMGGSLRRVPELFSKALSAAQSLKALCRPGLCPSKGICAPHKPGPQAYCGLPGGMQRQNVELRSCCEVEWKN